MNFTELACTTRLLLVTIVSTSCLSDCFAIWNLRFFELDLNLFVVFHAPLESAEVELALSLHESLAQLLALLKNPCWVFLAHLLDCSHHLFRVSLILCLNGTDIFRVRIFHEVETVVAVLAYEGVACANILELNCTTYVTSNEFFNLDTVCTSANEQLCHAFL